MEEGKIVQRGTHDDLMALPGAYREQVLAQRGSTSPDTPSSGEGGSGGTRAGGTSFTEALRT
jgi:hypothetical protein